METITREQAVIRFRKEILSKARFKAKQENLSLNAFLEKVVEEAVISSIPRLPKDYKTNPGIERVAGKATAPTSQQLGSDDKLAYIYNKGK